MIKNNIYTYNYFQPEEYKFSLDSVFLAQKVASFIKEIPDLFSWKVLDLCSGCGIIGLELSLHVNQFNQTFSRIDFLEIQELYLSYFQKNLEMIYPEDNKNYHFLNMNYQNLLVPQYENSYDLIVSNPPYFFKDEGLLSPSQFKNRCRFFLDSDFKTLIDAICFVLKPNASAFILVRKGNHHGRGPVQDMQKILGQKASAQIIDNVRGTDIIQIHKKAF
jgi:tRNA1(Val) A37 N6-methylase TrmN6